MKQLKRNSFIMVSHLIAVILAAVMMMGSASPAFALSYPSGTAYKEPVMVSLGDSYSSGEGVEPYYYSGREDRFSQPDWLAHRSRLSWPGKLQVPDQAGNRLVMSQNKAYYNNKTKSYDSYSKNNWYFVASSGAVTGSLRGTQGKSFDHDPSKESPLERGSYTLDNQLKVFDSIRPGTTDYVTMTIGGNDAHFADVFVYAAFQASFINVNGIDDYLNSIWNEFYNGDNSIKNRLIRAYNDVHNAAGKQANILIAGYPKILPKNGFIIFSAKESDSINNAIVGLNREMKGIVESLKSDEFKIHFVSVEEAFEGHEIYTGTYISYINGIQFAGAEDLEHAQVISSGSIHPNKRGVKAYADCVQRCIDQIEAEKEQNGTAEPVSTETQPLTADFYCESGAVQTQTGMGTEIPIAISTNASMKACTLHFEYDSEAVQIRSVSSADLCEDSISDTIGESDNRFDVTWSSTDSSVDNGTLFYINATALKAGETVIHVSAAQEDISDKCNRALPAHCEDITIQSVKGTVTLTADLSAFEDLGGAQIDTLPTSLCTLDSAGESLTAQTDLAIALTTYGTQAQLCLSKPGYTRLHINIAHLRAGQTVDMTAALRQAAAESRLMCPGDVNGDGCITLADISRLLASDLYGAPAGTTALPADVNGDGVLSLDDIAVMLRADTYGAADRTVTI